MSRSPLRNQYMVFETPVDNRFPLPLTLEAALEDFSHTGQAFDSTNYAVRHRRSERSLPVAPPSTRKNSFEYFDHDSLEKLRGESFSSNGSMPGMVEDHAGISDSDAEPPVERGPYEESMDRLWDTYRNLQIQGDHSEAAIFHDAYLPDHPNDSHLPPPLLGPEPTPPRKTSGPQMYAVSRPSKSFQAVARPSISAPISNQSNVTAVRRRKREPYKGLPFSTPISENENQTSALRHSHAQRSARQTSNPLKSLPPAPLEREECSVQTELQKRSKSLPPTPHPRLPSYSYLPYRASPATNPCNSSHSYSINTTPPLPPLPPIEKSVFDYDTENDGIGDLTSSITSKLNIRRFSLGSKLGFTPKKEKERRIYNTGRRRSASEIVKGVFGRSRK